jgi:hypothetical protein
MGWLSKVHADIGSVDRQASVCSAISKASSTSAPRYRTVLSSFERDQPASPINMNILGTPTDSVMLLP